MIYLKLGGSLITDKNQPHTSRPEVITRLFDEIETNWHTGLAGKLLLGHGSGSFGHVAGRRYGTRQGVNSPIGWLGFTEVWREARALNQIVCDAAAAAGLPAMAFPPSAGITGQDGQIIRWDPTPIQAALQAGLLPVIYGDVVFDQQRGGTIQSTEELFRALAREIPPRRILLAGKEPGVWADFPAQTRLIPRICPQDFAQIRGGVLGSAAVDVTGGMYEKVALMVDLVQRIPDLEVLIFSGEEPGNLARALVGENPGTLICNTQGGLHDL